MDTGKNIDIVIPWVDGNNPEWQARYLQYANITDGDKRIIRFRDWGLLPYWFRCIEKFAPWVRKIHFITSGELPEWLDTNHPKINWVKHEDFIPAEYLPTFNINAIETNIHRIDGLSEQFIYFNDDMFLIREAKPSDFFRNGKPCESAILDPIFPEEYPEIYVNAAMVLNRNFDKRTVIKKHFFKWMNLRYGKYLIKSLLMLPWRKFTGLLWSHLPQPFLKSTFNEVWSKETEILHLTGMAKFRNHTNVNQWIFRYWLLAKGDFSPANQFRKGVSFEIKPSTINHICHVISNQEMKQICINDGIEISDFEDMSNKLQRAFDSILPDKSSFEK